MSFYRVARQELCLREYFVEADDPECAYELVQAGRAIPELTKTTTAYFDPTEHYYLIEDLEEGMEEHATNPHPVFGT